jgi:uncharacterized damage-inducible protein DinB
MHLFDLRMDYKLFDRRAPNREAAVRNGGIAESASRYDGSMPEREQLRYPIGRWERPEQPAAEQTRKWIETIAAAPAALRQAVSDLSAEQLNTPYRPGGWTVRQLVHHFADSHVNSYVRFRLAATEQEPTIRPYDEKAWAELADARTAPVEISLQLIDALHDRWTRLLRSFNEADLKRRCFHPEIGAMTVFDTISMYAWHCRHHVAHATSLRERLGWS